MQDPRYPVGPFELRPTLTDGDRRQLIEQIAETPARMREAASALTEAQLDTPYREGGWTARQVIHHVPDSHMNAYIRLKLALTEPEPTIKPYEEARWAELPDSRQYAVEDSLQMLELLHRRWLILLRALRAEDFAKTFRHPDHGVVTIDWLLQMYAWHGRHHVGHVKSVRG